MLELLPLPAFSDNYIWMVHDGRRAVVVDPGDAAPVLGALESLNLVLDGILVTHHHPDHTGGIEGLRSALVGPVWAPARERTPEPRKTVAGGDRLTVLDRQVDVIDVPGHTAGHVAYHLQEPDGPGLLFCGDTLFSGGCGRLFEGTPQQMHASLQRLASLDPSTRVCCAHEYTMSNLKFARLVEPGNLDLAAYESNCRSLRDSGQPTLPSSIAIERRINPFLRCSEPAVVQSALQQGCPSEEPAAVLGALREWKNRS